MACSVCAQAALDKQEGTGPSTSQPQSIQGVSDASNSESTAGPRKLKQKKKAPAPAAQLLEDEGLNAELDAANAGGLVETERDRLIRTVRQLSSSAATQKHFLVPSLFWLVLTTLQLQHDTTLHVAGILECMQCALQLQRMLYKATATGNVGRMLQ